MAATAVVPSMKTALDNRRIDGAATQLATDVQFARSEAVVRQQPVRLTVLPACYVVHTGGAGDCRCDGSQTAHCEIGAFALKTQSWTAADPVHVESNVASLAFDPLLGTASPGATLQVVGPHDRRVRHVVNVMGRLRSCSPRAAVPGYAAC